MVGLRVGGAQRGQCAAAQQFHLDFAPVGKNRVSGGVNALNLHKAEVFSVRGDGGAVGRQAQSGGFACGCQRVAARFNAVL